MYRYEYVAQKHNQVGRYCPTFYIKDCLRICGFDVSIFNFEFI